MPNSAAESAPRPRRRRKQERGFHAIPLRPTGHHRGSERVCLRERSFRAIPLLNILTYSSTSTFSTSTPFQLESYLLICSVVHQFPRDRLPEDFSVPYVNAWRNNLTALSQIHNLYFVAYEDVVHGKLLQI